ncbi:RPS3C [Symbiodinium sp. CCMP2456]|nr:RPS3C [Symbiodinium sp. CCMP2456]
MARAELRMYPPTYLTIATCFLDVAGTKQQEQCPAFPTDGYAGVEVRVTPIRTEIIIRATRTREVLGEKGRRIRELTALVQKRFGFPENSVELFAERVENRASCAMAQCESLRFKLIGGLAVRRACYGVLRREFQV